MGFDFGHWAIQLYLADVYQVGMHNGIELENEAYSLNRFGLSYRTHQFGVEASFGVGKEEDEEGSGVFYTTNLSGHRINLTLYRLWKADWTYSLILRQLDFESSRFVYQSEAQTHALYVSYPWSRRYRVGGFFAVESHTNDFSQSGVSNSDSATYVKAGANFSLNF